MMDTRTIGHMFDHAKYSYDPVQDQLRMKLLEGLTRMNKDSASDKINFNDSQIFYGRDLTVTGN